MYAYGHEHLGLTPDQAITKIWQTLAPDLRAEVERRAKQDGCTPEAVLWDAVARFQDDWADPLQRPGMVRWLEQQRAPVGKDPQR